MIRELVGVLGLDEFYNESKAIDIAKGKNEIPKGFKQIKKSIKRQVKSNGRQEY